MNYSFNITECDAEALQSPQQNEESNAEYQARLESAKGKHFFRVIVQDEEAKQFNMASPYFDKDSDAQKWSVFDEGMKAVKKAIKASEKMKETTPKVEKSALITNGTEEAFKRLRGRN